MPGDELREALQARQLEDAAELRAKYGLSWEVATGLAAIHADMTEEQLRRPLCRLIRGVAS